MAGLQGSGKTTTSGKLANWLKNGGHRPLLVSVDVYRPAAREQLKVVAQGVKANIYEGEVTEANTATVERLAKEARREAINTGSDVLIVDTAGRLHIDGQLRRRVSQEAGTHWRCPHQDGWRRPRWRGAFHPPGYRAAHQVHRCGRKVRRPRTLPSRPHRLPHSGHGRHSLADRKSGAECR